MASIFVKTLLATHITIALRDQKLQYAEGSTRADAGKLANLIGDRSEMSMPCTQPPIAGSSH
jgi:hypothetical protein